MSGTAHVCEECGQETDDLHSQHDPTCPVTDDIEAECDCSTAGMLDVCEECCNVCDAARVRRELRKEGRMSV